jgi:hypothetical protein
LHEDQCDEDKGNRYFCYFKHEFILYRASARST